MDNASKVLKRAKDNQKSTEVIGQEEYYTEESVGDVDAEILRVSQLEKSLENLQRLDNLKRIRTTRRWFGKWFENSARKDCRQFVRHTNWKFYWPWHPETVIVDTVFLDVYKDGSVEMKEFLGHPFLIDHAESNYTEVTGKITLNRIEKWLSSESTKVTRYEKLM
jgi:hypothetical protein